VATTEVVVVTDSDLEVPAELDFLEVRAIGPNGKEQRASGVLSAERGLPRRVVLRHATGNLGPLHIVASGQKTGREVVSRTVDTAFQDGRQVVLHIALLRSCVGVACGQETCTASGCAPTEVVGDDLPDLGAEAVPSRLPSDPNMDASANAAGADEAGAASSAENALPRSVPGATMGDGAEPGTTVASATPDAGVSAQAAPPVLPADAGAHDAGQSARDASVDASMAPAHDASVSGDAGPILPMDGCVPSARCIRACQSAPRDQQAKACACLLSCAQ
jgi:hypothetical protein